MSKTPEQDKGYEGIQRRDFKDIGFTAVAELKEPNDVYAVRFEVYAIVAAGKDKVIWQRAGVPTYPDPTERLDEAGIYLHGDVKWDGCSNWYFDEQDNVMLHFCDVKSIRAISDVMERCWHWAGELMTRWEGE